MTTKTTNAEPGISSNINPTPAKRGRGRPKHVRAPGSRPKTIRNFSKLSDSLMAGIKLTGPEFRNLTEDEVIEAALLHYAGSLANQNPALAAMVRKVRS